MFKKRLVLLLFVFLLLLSFPSFAFAQERSISITVSAPGRVDEGLDDLIYQNKIDSLDDITSLTILPAHPFAKLNEDDFMALKELPNLHTLDLSAIACVDNYLPDEALGNRMILGNPSQSKYRNQIRFLTLPKDLEVIGSYAFCGLDIEGQLLLPPDLIEIGEGAFAYCDKLSGNLLLSNEIEKIGRNAFLGCSGLDGTLQLPANTYYQVIETGSFGNCAFTGNLNIPNQVKIIAQNAFYSPQHGKTMFLDGTLTLSNNIETIGANAFAHCSFANTLLLPDSLATLNDTAFYDANFTKISYHGQKLSSLDISAMMAKPTTFATSPSSSLKTIDVSGAKNLKTLVASHLPQLHEINIDGCDALKKIDLSNNAFDLSAGKEKQWTDNFSGTLDVSNQRPILTVDVSNLPQLPVVPYGKVGFLAPAPRVITQQHNTYLEDIANENWLDKNYLKHHPLTSADSYHVLFTAPNGEQSETLDSTQSGTHTLDYTFGGVYHTLNYQLSVEVSDDLLVIEAMAGRNGAISPEGEIVCQEGEDLRFTFLPDNGYEVDSVLVDGERITLQEDSYVFEDITSSHAIDVSFKKIDSTSGEDLHTGIRFAGDKNLLQNSSFYAKQVLSGDNFMLAMRAMDGYSTSFKTYELGFFIEEKPLDFKNATVDIYIPIEDEWTAESLQVHRIKPDGSLVSYATEIEDGYAHFEMDGNGLYVLAQMQDGLLSVNALSPKTGLNIPVLLFTLTVLLNLLTVFMIWSDRKKRASEENE